MEYLEDTSVSPKTPGDAGKNSKLGIASFAVAIAGILMLCMTFFAINWLVHVDGQQLNLDHAGMLALLRVVTTAGYCGPILNILGIGLGIGSLLQKSTKKLFGVLGIILGTVVLCLEAGFSVL